MFSIHDMSDDSGLPSATGESDGKNSASYLLTCYVMFCYVMLCHVMLYHDMSHLSFPLYFIFVYLFTSLACVYLYHVFIYFNSFFLNFSMEYLYLFQVPTAGPFSIRLPSLLNLSHERLSSEGIFLMENGTKECS